MKCFISGFYHFFLQIVMWLPFFYLRKYILILFGMKIGKHTFIARNVDIRCPYRVRVGCFTTINKGCLLDGRGGHLTIGDNVDIAQYTSIFTLQHDYNSPDHASEGGDVKINDYCWIASNATILPGKTLGRGAVVATHAVVTKDVPALAVVAGIPAKSIAIRKDNMRYHCGQYEWFM